MDIAEQYPFLHTALEDYASLARLGHDRPETPRHGILMMHDVLEFTLYEILILRGVDIYRNGQNTIGFDGALKEFLACGFDMPLIGSVRRIQKLRGDAKHHAQAPSEKDYARLVRAFRIVVSRLIHEHFGASVGPEIESLGLMPYHTALFECYRKYRNHNWERAQKLCVSAVLHKHRRLLGDVDDFRSMFASNLLSTIATLEAEIGDAVYPAAPEAVLTFLGGLTGVLRELTSSGDAQEAAEQAGQAYSRIDGVTPAIFDIGRAKKLTEHLYQPDGLEFEGGMAWSWWSRGDTKTKADYGARLEELLRSKPDLVKSLGEPYEEYDEDRMWRWWEFAVFDGVRWHSFMLTGAFHLNLEMGGIEGDFALHRESLARLILEEFSKCVSEPAKDAQGRPPN
ncbi:hypothetical protein KAW64_14075 [bacterium]|nr:hypothetical protein [bacterium]